MARTICQKWPIGSASALMERISSIVLRELLMINHLSRVSSASSRSISGQLNGRGSLADPGGQFSQVVSVLSFVPHQPDLYGQNFRTFM